MVKKYLVRIYTDLPYPNNIVAFQEDRTQKQAIKHAALDVDSGKLHISHIKKIALCDLQDGSKNKAISLATLQATLKANKGD